ncbi:uncharacterized protein LOC134187970 [Corticium candelabrum]|uniref:uncharacterized protein LOC134187970 n=1 Tax=Corticium candelabrum TaxID=121492 RepID=UPI002E25F2C2|nr:uncharacterized protein LOC134187970 [Corticium candelabrum]
MSLSKLKDVVAGSKASLTKGVNAVFDMCARTTKAVEDLLSALQPDQALARLLLSDLKHLLDRCWQAAKRARRLFRGLVDIAAGPLVREAKRQLDGESIDRKLLEKLVKRVCTRLKLVKESVGSFKQLGVHKSINAAEAEVRALHGRIQSAKKLQTGAFVIAVVSGAAGLILCTPSLTAAIIGASVTTSAVNNFRTVLGLGQESNAEVSKNVEDVVTNLQKLLAEFQKVYDDFRKVDNDMDDIDKNSQDIETDTTFLHPRVSATADRIDDLEEMEYLSALISDLEEMRKDMQNDG